MGTTSEKLTYLNTTKTLIKEELNLGGANISTEPFRAYSSKLKGIYKDFLANGTDTLWNNWEKVSGSGETLSLTPTIKGRIQSDLKGNTQQNGTPTPDSPIPIQVVSGDNTIKVEGKNLFDLSTLFKNKFGGNTTSDKGITFTNNNETINLNGTSTGTAECIIGVWNGPAPLIELDSSQTYTLKIFGKEKSGNTVVCGVDIRGIKNGSASKIIYGSDNTDTIELTGWSSIVYIDIYTQYTSGAINKNISIQLVKGSTIPTTYTPYVSQTYPISLGNIELCKIGTYQDSIVKDNGKWYLNKQIGKVVLDGSENWTLNSQSGDSYRYFLNGSSFTSVFVNCIDEPESRMTDKTLCDHYSFKLFSSTQIGTYTLNNYLNVSWFLLNTNITTLADFKTWLSTHNTEVYYVLATSTYEEITDTTLLSQLEALAYSYEGTTNISQVNDDLAFVLDITALKDI